MAAMKLLSTKALFGLCSDEAGVIHILISKLTRSLSCEVGLGWNHYFDLSLLVPIWIK